MSKSPSNAFSQLTGHQLTAEEIEKNLVKSKFSVISHSINVPFISNRKTECPVPKKIQPEIATSSEHGHLDDIETLSAMELRKRYKGEANSHKNMLARQKTNGAKVHLKFKNFTNFLKILGPKPTKKATLDRIDNNDPEYAPGKVR